MQFQDKILCDFCFEPIEEGEVCANCGLTHETYHLDGGLLAPGTNLMGKYIIGKALGRGGFGATYLAYSAERASRVAIKEYFPVSIVYRAKGEEEVTLVSEEQKEIFEKGAQRFFDEAQTISRFNMNPNIVSVYEFFNANSTVYYSMEYLEGTDLKKYITSKGGRLVESEVISITKSVCNALMVVHSAQFLHRDISPDNIFMCADGGVKLIDFGTAKQVIANEHQSYSVVVKQGFAPAEQYTRKGNQGVWTDIYALGATMYYTLLGRVPPDSIDRVDEPELNFSSPYKDVTGNFCAVINKCMAMQKEMRYQSVVDLIADLDRVYSMSKLMEDSLSDTAGTDGDIGSTTMLETQEIASTTDVSQTQKKGIAAILANKKLMAIIGGGIAACVAICIVLINTSNKPSTEGGGGGGGTTVATEQMETTTVNAPADSASVTTEQVSDAGQNEDAPKQEIQQSSSGNKTSGSGKNTSKTNTKTQTQKPNTTTTTPQSSSAAQPSVATSGSSQSVTTSTPQKPVESKPAAQQSKPNTSSSAVAQQPQQQQPQQQQPQKQQQQQQQPQQQPQQQQPKPNTSSSSGVQSAPPVQSQPQQSQPQQSQPQQEQPKPNTSGGGGIVIPEKNDQTMDDSWGVGQSGW